jgi:hypothetical protein
MLKHDAGHRHLYERVLWCGSTITVAAILFGFQQSTPAKSGGERWLLGFLGLLTLAFSLFALRRSPFSWFRTACQSLRVAFRDVGLALLDDIRRLGRADKAQLLLILILALIVRGVFALHPITYDEAYTGEFFVSGGLGKAFLYTYPNNHVLHTLLTKAVTGFLGLAPVQLRVVSIFWSLLSVAALFLVARRALAGSGFWAALAVAVWPALVAMDSQARGYSMTHFFCVALLYVGSLWLSRKTNGLAALFGLLAALSLFAVPTALFSIATIGLWVVLAKLSEGAVPRVEAVKFAVVSGLVAMGVASALYAPVIWANNGIDALLNNRFVTKQTWDVFIEGVPRHGQTVFQNFSRGVFPGASVWLPAAALLGAVGLRRKRAMLLLVAMGLGSAIVLLYVRRLPYERTWLYAIPLTAAVGDAVFSESIRRMRRAGAAFCARAIALVVVAMALVIYGANMKQALPDARRPDPVRVVACWIGDHARTSDVYFGDSLTHERLMYYFRVMGISCTPLGRRPTGSVFYVIHTRDIEKPYLNISLSGAKPVFEVQGVRVYVFSVGGEGA